MKIILYFSSLILILSGLTLTAEDLERLSFNKETDLFIAQFDCLPDSDDVYSQAAVGCLLSHADFQGVNYLAVTGAYGVQVRNKRFKFIDTQELMKAAYGKQALPTMSQEERRDAGWVNAHGKLPHKQDEQGRPIHSVERNQNLAFASEVVQERVRPVLESGGRVFIMEAGQSDFTADWVEALIQSGVKNTSTNIILVQHSAWNETHTSGKKWTYSDGKDDWAFINNAENLHYVQIDDGNQPYGSKVKDRGEHPTPGYVSRSKEFLKSATSPENPNKKARELWTLAQRIALASSYNGKVIRGGGVDFSDTVEAMWIFNLSLEKHQYTTVDDFWEAFVINE